MALPTRHLQVQERLVVKLAATGKLGRCLGRIVAPRAAGDRVHQPIVDAPLEMADEVTIFLSAVVRSPVIYPVRKVASNTTI